MNNPQAKEKKLEYSKPQLYSLKDYGAKVGGRAVTAVATPAVLLAIVQHKAATTALIH